MSQVVAQTNETVDRKAEDTAESAYRRGYQQGANDTLMAVERMIRSRLDFADLRDWIGYSLYEWRNNDRVDDRTVEPPSPPCD